MVVVLDTQVSKSFKIMTRQGIGYSVRGRGYPDSRYGDVEECRNEKKGL